MFHTPMPDHLIVIRSASTDYERQGRIRGSLDIPPSAEGLAKAEQIADRLSAAPPDAIYAAPTACAGETARIIGGRFGIAPKHLERLANLDLGLWQGKLVDEIRRLQPRVHRQWQEDPWSVAPPEGEILEEARGRVEQALERIRKRHPRGRVAVVIPFPLDSLVRWLVAGEPLGDLWEAASDRDSLAVIPMAAQWKTTRHLPMTEAPEATSSGAAV
jgi:probable phosphoglycerate mutase